jgi:NADH-quinone oxidoreductase subunit N
MLKSVIAEPGGIWLAVFAILMAAVSVYYYFRVIQAMYFREGESGKLETTSVFRGTLVVLAALVILLGIFPNLILNWFYF